MHIPALSEADKRLAKGVWTLLQQLGDKDRLPTIGVAGPKGVRRVLHAKHTFIGPNREPYYYFTEGNKQRVRSWFSPDGRLKDPDSFAMELQEIRDKAAAKAAKTEARKMRGVTLQEPRGRKPVAPSPGVRDMLSAFRAKALGYEE